LPQPPLQPSVWQGALAVGRHNSRPVAEHNRKDRNNKADGEKNRRNNAEDLANLSQGILPPQNFATAGLKSGLTTLPNKL